MLLLFAVLFVAPPQATTNPDRSLDSPMNAQTILLSDTQQEVNWTIDVRSGPFFVAVDCSAASNCPQTTLTLTEAGGTVHQATERFRIELSGNLSAGTHTLSISRDSSSGDLSLMLTTIWLDPMGGEFLDAPNDLPAPGSDATNWPMLSAVGCGNYTVCGAMDRGEIGSASSWWNGSLSDVNDIDTLLLNGSEGDLFEIELAAHSTEMTIEIWNRTNDDLQMLSSRTHGLAQPPESESRQVFSQPTGGELWLFLMTAGGEGGVYSLNVARHGVDLESEFGDLPGIPFLSPEHVTGSPASGHLGHEDNAGDMLKFPAGSRSKINIEWASSVPSDLSLHVHNLTWEIFTTYPSSVGSDIDVILPEGADGFALGFDNQSSALIWTLLATDLGPHDAGYLGDATDHHPTGEADATVMQEYIGASGTISGSLDVGDQRDVYLIERELGFPDRSWFSTTLESEPGCCRVSIEQLNTSTYIGWTTVASNSSDLVSMSTSVGLELDHGRHLLVIEPIDPVGEQVDYTLLWGWATIEDGNNDTDEQWQDMSGEFRNFYILVGVLLLSPWLLIFYWRWKDGGTIRLEEHERRRLLRLRERLVAADVDDSNDPHALEDALISLEDTDWEALIMEWGEPAVRHLTEGIDLACWRLESSAELVRLAVGISVGSESWTLAALRFQAVEGAEWIVGTVVPEAMIEDDELFLGELVANTERFLRVDLEGSADGLDIHLSGLVGGNPIAAIPTHAVMLEEE